ncbi:HAMP domain-containing protein/CheY-like chemotaxis protein/signal transduction histidine kinase [Lysobacter niabensis]|uniref:histidine kinase n=1 Tax=Agrilutibacter niabensis TaxID=380628 RepID=A0ABU1VRS5_9GAMM|nr:HAMP domain-containing protein [Lysobacter niabensis]MDR7100157.1 HAMP domain-containing protein/CheY-like chemotaxis protein/signal transduction histidine kinase [Lysobacter niabensis]
MATELKGRSRPQEAGDDSDPMLALLAAMQAVTTGDFSVALPAHWPGVEGKLADAFNTIVQMNRRLAQDLQRVGVKVGREGQTRQRLVPANRQGAWAGMEASVNDLIDDLVRPVETMTEAMAGVAKGDLTRTVPLEADGRPLQGEFLRSATIVNRMIEQMGEFSSEVTRVALEVGTAGRLGGQAKVKGVSGVWKDLTDSVNQMASNLTGQVRNISEVTIAVANGDLSRKITVDVRGEILQLKEAINTMVDQLRGFASEVTRVAREVGTEGKLGGQAIVPGVAGTWKDLTDSVNAMASNLTSQVRNIAEVTTAVAKGDLSRKITVDVRGEILEVKNTVNTMVDQLNGFAAEVTRVAREVGTEGKLGGQAQVPDVAGTWKDLTDHVNSMASNLTSQVRNIAEVTTAVAKGDLSRKITVDVRGEIQELKDTINTMVDQLNGFAAEVTRVAREVGTEGRLGGQAVVPGVAGTWKDLTDSVNAMASNLTSQVRNIAEVTTAVARGDLSRKITVDVRGEILELKNTINTMVDQLNGFAAEVTRVAREVGTEGKLGGQAQVPGVAGTWKDLTDNVNSMASNLTAQVRNIAEVTTAVAKGDLSRKIAVDVKGEILQLKETINTMVDQLNGFAAEVTRVAREVGTEGKLGGQAQVPGVAGTWKDLTDNVNSMASNLTTQVRNIADVATSVAKGDLSRKIAVGAEGEILQLKETLNTMVDQLNGFAAEVTRVAREVGTEGKLGGQAQVPGVAGTWKDLTDNVNSMASNLTTQVRGIAKVVTAVANGDLHKKLTVEAKGEVAELADTINAMTNTLAIFADQVTTVAREVGVEGRLGGQAKVPGTAGIWKDLTANVNQLAANLTNQVRAIADVATAVTQGDLTRSIQVDVRGEVADLKDNINAMIGTLRATTESNREQDWLKTNLAMFSGKMQGQRDLITLGHMLLSELAPLVNAQQAVMYVVEPSESHDRPVLRQLAGYADSTPGDERTLEFGEGLIGQCAAQGQIILLDNMLLNGGSLNGGLADSAPASSVRISSGLFSAAPRNVIVLPVLFEDQVKAVIELASLGEFSPSQRVFLEQLSGLIGIVLNTIVASMRTESLLSQSQQLAGELQSQQKELQQTNEEIALKAALLAQQNREVESKNLQIEHARRALEDKAAELALTSRYKSEFLANMSHELRTPLNSILILGQQLAENPDANLSTRQVEFAKTIHAAGTDLLHLISDILDLSKIESGTVTVDSEEIAFEHLRENMLRSFHHEAERRSLDFSVDLAPGLGHALTTDPKRLQQILKNLLSNALKFTDQGSVRMHIGAAASGWTAGHTILDNAPSVVAFEVRDTGIGISPEKQKIVFEAFQQADAGTSRKYGGTGLGLAISREIAGLLGGELRLHSDVGKGSAFTLYLPLRYAGPDEPHAARAASMLPAAALASEGVAAPEPEQIEDDRDRVQPGEPILLVIEDDARYAAVLRDMARAQGFRVLVANRGAEALRLVREYKPTAVSLDIFLPDMLGWTALARLKQDSSTRHIPVQIVTIEEERHQSIERGAFAYLAKPATSESIAQALQRIKEYTLPRVKRLLVIEDDAGERLSIEELIRHDDVSIDTVGSGAEALEALGSGQYDCAVLDLRLPDMSGFDLLDRVKEVPLLQNMPIVVFTGKELTAEEHQRLKKAARSIIIKGVESPERLLDETALFLHRVIADLPAGKRQMVQRLHESDETIRSKRVLVVDDDVRNIFALSSVLERHGMDVVTAGTGQEAIEKVAADPDIDLVLMDIMMPGMDGYDTMRAIREQPESRSLPIVALTAKAMKGDREKCLEAGASDYLAKPVVTDQLLGMLRQWLHR